MPNIPARGLAQGGIIRDQHPTSLPLPSWTAGRNVIFDNGKCSRAPVWRRAASDLNGSSSVRFCIARTTATGYSEIIVARDDTSLVRVSNGSQVDASEAGWSPQAATTAAWTGEFLGDVLYVNRPDIAPRSLLPGASAFTVLPHWDPTWRCRALRKFQDSLVALGITKGATAYPSTLAVSDQALYGTVPGSWDSTDPTKLAYETPLARLTGPILDGLALGDRFLIYSADQVVEMTANGNFIYGFETLPFRDGILATNCAVEVDGLHYVFGSRDLYVTDGQTKKSIAENRIKDALFSRLNMSLRDRAFVAFLPDTNSVLFAYVSGDDDAAWSSPTGCNSGWVYNRNSDTWAPIDLPNVSSMTSADLDTILTYDTAGSMTYDTVGGTYYGQEDGKDKHVIALSAPLNTPGSVSAIVGGGTLLGYDFIDRGRLALPLETPCIAPSYVERVGIALDNPAQGAAPLVATKLIRSIVPEISVSKPGTPVRVSLAGTMTPFAPVDFGQAVSFIPDEDYLVDHMADGRYLAARFDFPDTCDTELSGFDIDVVSNGRR